MARSRVVGMSLIQDPREIERLPEIPPCLRAVFSEFPFLGGITEAATAWADRDFRNRLIEFLEGLAADVQTTPDRVIERIQSDERLRTIFFDVVSLATRTHLIEKRTAMRKALAKGLLAEDDAKVDEAELLLRALRDLEAPHLKVLWFLHTLPSNLDQRGQPSPPGGVDEIYLAERLPGTEHVLEPILTTLARHSLIRNVAVGTWDGIGGVKRWVISSFGRALIELVQVDTEQDANLEGETVASRQS